MSQALTENRTVTSIEVPKGYTYEPNKRDPFFLGDPWVLVNQN